MTKQTKSELIKEYLIWFGKGTVAFLKWLGKVIKKIFEVLFKLLQTASENYLENTQKQNKKK